MQAQCGELSEFESRVSSLHGQRCIFVSYLKFLKYASLSHPLAILSTQNSALVGPPLCSL